MFGGSAFSEVPFSSEQEDGELRGEGHAVCLAIASAESAVQHAAGGSAVGEAFASLTSILYSEGDALGEAIAEAAATRLKRLEGDATAEAITGATPSYRLGGEGYATGFALTSGYANRVRRLNGDAVCQAIVTGYADQYSPVVNPPLAGDLVDPADTSNLKLTVAGSLLPLDAEAFWNIDDLVVGYDGKELRFSEIATPEIGWPTFDPEDSVLFEIDWTGTGSFFQTIFSGEIRSREHVGENNQEAINYTAFGVFQLANEITCLNTMNRPDITYTVGTTTTSVTGDGTEVRTTFAKPIREAVEDLFTIMGTHLGSVGIPATIGYPGLEQFSGDLPETVTLSNQGFSAALGQIAGYESGVKPYFNDDTQTWQFHNLLEAPVAIVAVNSVNLESAIFNMSTEDRFTAIRLFSNEEDNLDDNIQAQDGVVSGKSGLLSRSEISLTPKWVSELETDWTIIGALQNNPWALESQNYWVYKRWEIDQNAIDQFPGTPFKVRQKVNFWGTERWVALPADINFTRREVIAKNYAIHRGNPYIPGDVIGPKEVTLTYYPRQSNFTLATTVTSAGSTVQISTTVPPTDILDDIRYPTAGWEGTAFDLFGVERELIQSATREEMTVDNAIGRLATFKDVVVAGDLPIGGDMLEQFIELNRQVRVQHPTKKTGVESFNAMFMQYSYAFGKRGQSTLTLTTDVSGLIKSTS